MTLAQVLNSLEVGHEADVTPWCWSMDSSYVYKVARRLSLKISVTLKDRKFIATRKD